MNGRISKQSPLVLGSNPIRSITRPNQVLPFQPGPVEPSQGLEYDLFQINTSESVDLTVLIPGVKVPKPKGQARVLLTLLRKSMTLA